ncbi:MAG TPA: glutamate-5-semialdehyde dehydrogenase [Candidatus Thermoplasmatota archaeon]|nr:glutamate-5-semialdehyde dehydrogenase [Candidatus Thermoplasmatota archaeon]
MTDAVRGKAERARAAALRLQATSDAQRAQGVLALAGAIERATGPILAANAEDLRDAERADLAKPLLDRLKLSPEKLRLTLEGVRSLAHMPDPLGRTLRSTLLDDGLRLYQVSVPLGVVACVFESRPDAAIQIPALALRTGNAALLKGGREAERTNRAIVDAMRAALFEPDSVQLLEGRAEVDAVLKLDGLVDLVIPRGSSEFVRHVMDSTRIPVLGHAAGVCHVYVHEAADVAKAVRIALDAKVDNPSACNAAETLLVDAGAKHLVRPLVEALAKSGVEVRAAPEILELVPAGAATAAREEDFGVEFGDLRIAVALVDGVDAAVAFVNAFGSRHTDAIVTEDKEAARRFVAGVDSAGVFVNASPRFADGYRYGLGAEVGVSTSKIHARGPVGMDGLTTTKWVLLGEGHVASAYQGKDPKSFKHASRPDAAWSDELSR